MDLRSGWFAVESEAVAYLMHAHIVRNASKPKGREHFLVVVGFEDSSHLLNGVHVLVVIHTV